MSVFSSKEEEVGQDLFVTVIHLAVEDSNGTAFANLLEKISEIQEVTETRVTLSKILDVTEEVLDFYVLFLRYLTCQCSSIRYSFIDFWYLHLLLSFDISSRWSLQSR